MIDPTEHHAWLSRVRDALNKRGVMVATCDLKRRTNLEVCEAQDWAAWNGSTERSALVEEMPEWLRPFMSRHGESILQTRQRARAENADVQVADDEDRAWS